LNVPPPGEKLQREKQITGSQTRKPDAIEGSSETTWQKDRGATKLR